MTQETITLHKSSRLIALEKTIEAGRKTFVEVGLALAEIRDSRLYRADFDTFEAYCREKWGWKRDYCDKLIAGANVVKQLPEKLHTIVGTETRARELAKIEPAKRVEVLERAAEDGPVTAKKIQEAMSEIEQSAPVPKIKRKRHGGDTISIDTFRIELDRLIEYLPEKQSSLLTCVRILESRAKKLRRFTEKAKG